MEPTCAARLAVVAAAALALSACGGNADARRAARSGADVEDPGEAVTAPPPVAGAVRTHGDVTIVPAECGEGSDDDCDGLDDDCDGAIDEGCGLASGVVQVTAAWGTGADVDLYVEEPLGDTLSFQRGRSSVGGRVDRVGRGACVPRGEPTRVESLVWEGDAVLRGTYRVSLHYWGECQSLAGPTEVTVSVAVAGHVVTSVRYVLSPNELLEVATFAVE